MVLSPFPVYPVQADMIAVHSSGFSVRLRRIKTFDN